MFARIKICQKCVCSLGSTPDPTGGAQSAPLDSLAGLGGGGWEVAGRKGEGKGKDMKGDEGRGGESKERDMKAEKWMGGEGIAGKERAPETTYSR